MKISRQEARWVLRAQAGDREALDEILRILQEPLHRYISSLVGRTALAEDILQEVFILIYRNLRWLREPGLFRAWAYRIAGREAFKHLRRERRRAEQSIDESNVEGDPGMTRDILSADTLEPLVARVSPASRAVIVLHYMHEIPLAEVAAILGVPLGTVKSRLAYGLDCLRTQIRRSQCRKATH